MKERFTAHKSSKTNSAYQMKAINTSTIVRLFSFLLLFCAAFPAKSQNEESLGFVGEWCNKNFATRGNTQINVRHDGTKLIVHMWGRCHPTECDLGERPATQSPSESLLVTWKESFATITQKLTLLADGNLQSSSRTRFTDNSGRTDYESNETFVKGLVHDWSDTPKDRRPRIPNPPTAPPPVGKTIPAPTVPQPKQAEPRKIAVFGAINEKWKSLGAGGGILGQPVSAELPTFDKVGRRQEFQRGVISWHPALGAFAVYGPVNERWRNLGREVFGYPVTDTKPTTNRRGTFVHFRPMQGKHNDSSIFSQKDGVACAVYGVIRQRWADLGWEGGKLGFPTKEEYDVQVNGVKGRRVDFENGYIVWSPKTGARETFAGTIDNGPVLVPADE